MSVIETEKATDVIVEYFDLICDTDYAFDETEILRRMNANAIDAVPIIRCKDCKYGVYETYGEYGHYCCHDQYIETGEEYCAWAEPKDTTEEVRKQLKDMEQRREMDRKK